MKASCLVWLAGLAVSCQTPPTTLAGPVPALAPAIDVDPDPDVVEVHLAVGWTEVEYLDGVATRVLAYRDEANPDDTGRVPGPMIVARRGDTVVLRLRNDMPVERTTLHMHGVRLPANMDGNPAVSGAIDPGHSFEYRFVARDAGYFWYHPHINTDEHLELGLQGPIVILEPDRPATTERWFMIDDIDLDDVGQVVLDMDETEMRTGRQGDLLLVNGRPGGVLRAAAGATERWHLVNSANARHLDLIVPGAKLTVIGWDGGAIARPYEVERLAIAPGERFDVLVALPAAPGRVLDVRTGPVLSDPGTEVTTEVTTEEIDARHLFSIVLDDRPDEYPAPVSDDFAGVEPALAIDGTTPTKRFTLRADFDRPGPPLMSINDQVWPFNEAVHVTLGDTEIWEVENLGPGMHPFHLHGLFFQVLAGAAPFHLGGGWKDTVPIGPYSTVRVAVQYDAPGHWLYHCQIPEHAHMGMMGDLLVDVP